MKGILICIGLVWSLMAMGQNSDLTIIANDTVDFALFIEGREYKTDNAPRIKITEIPEGAYLNINVITKSAQPMAYFGRLEFQGSHEWVYQLTVPKRGNKLELVKIEKIEKSEGYKSFDLKDNFIVYKYNKYANPIERVSGTVDAASSLNMKREREKKDTTRVEGNKQIKEKSERKRTVKESGSSTIIHTERSTTGEGDERETKILKPRKTACEGPWDSKTRDSEMQLLATETREAGKIYMSKKIANANCFSTKDAKAFLQVFENESSRIEIAKFIYPSLIDPENFDQLESEFDSSSSFEAVKLYVEIKYE
ncbi:MAG: DUF4476 domain-containing protein [Bacteroidia bacterium]